MVRLTVLVTIAATQLFVFEATASAQAIEGLATAQHSSADVTTREAPLKGRPTDLTASIGATLQGRPDIAEGTLHADAPRLTYLTPQPIRDSLATLDFGRYAPVQAARSGQKRSVGRRVLGGAIGATGGLFAGGYLGAAIEGDRCNCDDPGLMGALIGAPVGAVIGGILGALFF